MFGTRGQNINLGNKENIFRVDFSEQEKRKIAREHKHEMRTSF